MIIFICRIEWENVPPTRKQKKDAYTALPASMQVDNNENLHGFFFPARNELMGLLVDLGLYPKNETKIHTLISSLILSSFERKEWPIELASAA